MTHKENSSNNEFSLIQHEDYVETVFNEPIKIEIELAREMIELRKAFTNYQDSKVLIDSRNVKGMTKEARDHLSSAPGFEHVIGAAIITDSAISALVVNFFVSVNINRAPVPLKMFSKKEKALNWLRQL